MEDLETSQSIANKFIASFELGGVVGSLTAGYLSDFISKLQWANIMKPFGNDRLALALCYKIILGITLHVLCFHLSTNQPQLNVLVIGFVCGLCVYGAITTYGLVATEGVPIQISGTAHAIVALAANVGSIFAGLPLATFANYYNWQVAFFMLELLSWGTVILMLSSGTCLRSAQKYMKETDNEQESCTGPGSKKMN